MSRKNSGITHGMRKPVVDPKPEYQRDELDRFYTQKPVADLFAREALKLFGGKKIEYFIEPSCGDGALINALGRAAKEYHVTVDWCHAVDIDPARKGGPDSSDLVCDHYSFAHNDWLDEATAQVGKADLILSNPPFAESVLNEGSGKERRVAIIQKHVEKMLASLTQGGLCGVLAAQRFLGKPRDTWLSTIARPFKIQQLCPRPSFTANGKTDMSEYVFCWWEMFDGDASAKETTFEWVRWRQEKKGENPGSQVTSA